MAGLLSGLEQFGLGNLEEMNLYEEPKKNEKAEESSKGPTVQESDYLFEKTYNCPVCDFEFKVKTVKVGKAKLLGTDLDLRPKYENIDMLKYDVILCPHCGYTALSRYFKFITASQTKAILGAITKNFKPFDEKGDTYTYEEALERYKLALANAIVKQAKPSEKGYICLKAGWLLRGMGEAIAENDKDADKKKAECAKAENDFLKSSLEGFLAARQTEEFPLCGMDESTVDYLIAVTALRFEQYDLATKLVSGILTSPVANHRMKDKTRDLRDILMKKIKENKASK